MLNVLKYSSFNTTVFLHGNRFEIFLCVSHGEREKIPVGSVCLYDFLING